MADEKELNNSVNKSSPADDSQPVQVDDEIMDN